MQWCSAYRRGLLLPPLCAVDEHFEVLLLRCFCVGRFRDSLCPVPVSPHCKLPNGWQAPSFMPSFHLDIHATLPVGSSRVFSTCTSHWASNDTFPFHSASTKRSCLLNSKEPSVRGDGAQGQRPVSLECPLRHGGVQGRSKKMPHDLGKGGRGRESQESLGEESAWGNAIGVRRRSGLRNSSVDAFRSRRSHRRRWPTTRRPGLVAPSVPQLQLYPRSVRLKWSELLQSVEVLGFVASLLK